MKLKEFIEKGCKVEVDVPVLTSREFDVEGFIKDDGEHGNMMVTI